MTWDGDLIVKKIGSDSVELKWTDFDADNENGTIYDMEKRLGWTPKVMIWRIVRTAGSTDVVFAVISAGITITGADMVIIDRVDNITHSPIQRVLQHIGNYSTIRGRAFTVGSGNTLDIIAVLKK